MKKLNEHCPNIRIVMFLTFSFAAAQIEILD